MNLVIIEGKGYYRPWRAHLIHMTLLLLVRREAAVGTPF
jgi:hypothetical protein